MIGAGKINGRVGLRGYPPPRPAKFSGLSIRARGVQKKNNLKNLESIAQQKANTELCIEFSGTTLPNYRQQNNYPKTPQPSRSHAVAYKIEFLIRPIPYKPLIHLRRRTPSHEPNDCCRLPPPLLVIETAQEHPPSPVYSRPHRCSRLRELGYLRL